MTGNRRPQPSRKIAYLVKTFPKVSETFILQEILELERQGMSLTIYSLYPPTDVEEHPSVADIQSQVYYLSGQSSPVSVVSLESHQWLINHQLQRYSHTLNYFQNRKDWVQPNELALARELAMSLNSQKIDHLHAHFATEPTSVAELVYELSGIPFSFTAHAKDIYLSDRNILKRKIRTATFVTTCTDYNRKYLETISSGETPIHLIYHGLDLEKFQPVSMNEEATSTATPIILSIGRFREKKGFPTLIQACCLLKERGVSFQCRIVGYGPLESVLETMIREKGLNETVTLIGKKSHDEIIDMYRQATLFVLPCQMAGNGDRDGIPNVLMEAMAMGVPVVTTNVSGIPELVRDHVNGLVVNPLDPEALGAAIENLLGDRVLQTGISRAGRETLERKFSASQHVSKIKELYLAHKHKVENSGVSVTS